MSWSDYVRQALGDRQQNVVAGEEGVDGMRVEIDRGVPEEGRGGSPWRSLALVIGMAVLPFVVLGAGLWIVDHWPW